MIGTEYGYLLSTLLGLPGVAAMLWAGGALRRSLWLAGAIEFLHVPPLLWFNGPYWSPPRLGGWGLGVEDVLVCFSIGVGAWFFATWPMRERIALDLAARRVIGRLALVALPSTAFAWVAWRLGAGVMEVLLLTMAATFAVLALRRPAHLRLAAAGALLYTPYYLAILFLTEALFPGFFRVWNGPELWGARLFGLPLEELAFVAAYGATWPMILGFTFTARLRLAA